MKKKMISVLTVTGLIFLVLAAGIITMFVKRYAPSKEMMDQKEYFGLTQDDQAALVVNNELKEEKLKIMDGRYYVEDDVVGKYINGRFYWDAKQNVMLYTLPTEILQIMPDTQQFQTSQGVQNTDYVILKATGDSYYLDLEFIKNYSDMEYTVYENPNRVVIQTKWPEFQQVTVKKDSEIRQKGGIKSIIVDTVEKDEKMYLQEEMETWSKVSTKDGYTGYIKKEDISAPETVQMEYASTMPEFTRDRKSVV